jgi:hypothetical protein
MISGPMRKSHSSGEGPATGKILVESDANFETRLTNRILEIELQIW